VEQKGTLMSIRGSDQANFPEHLKEPVEVFRRAKTVWSVEYRQWYPKLGKAVEDATAALLSGNITPEQFVERLEAAAEAARQDKNLPKHTYKRGQAR
jgi:N-acetylglucosamine transport system substrate-binding protein